jgi:hypothetical protein
MNWHSCRSSARKITNHQRRNTKRFLSRCERWSQALDNFDARCQKKCYFTISIYAHISPLIAILKKDVYNIVKLPNRNHAANFVVASSKKNPIVLCYCRLEQATNQFIKLPNHHYQHYDESNRIQQRSSLTEA